MVEDEETEQMLSVWLEHIQKTTLASIVPERVLRDEPESSYRLSGHCMLTCQLRETGCNMDSPVLRTMKPRLCLHTICELASENLSPKFLMPHVYEYLSLIHI